MRIAFIVPNLEIGGGVSVMLRHAAVARQQGHAVTIVNAASDGTIDSRDHIASVPVVALERAREGEYEVAIATWWEDLRAFPNIHAGHHVLFLQRLEDRIYVAEDPRGSLVREVFGVELPVITIADSLRREFQAQFGRDAAVVKNGIDKAVFKQSGDIAAARRGTGMRILVEGPLGVWFKNVVPALRLSRSRALETWLLTSTNVGSIWGVDQVFSRLDPPAAAAVYRSCDVLLKLSTIEGLPLPPLEMFHCGGTTVAFEVSGVCDYAVHGRNALLASEDDYACAGSRLDDLIADPELLAQLKRGALDTARAWPSEEDAGLGFLTEIESIVTSYPPTSASTMERLSGVAWPTSKVRRSLPTRLRRTRVAQSVYHSVGVRR